MDRIVDLLTTMTTSKSRNIRQALYRLILVHSINDELETVVSCFPTSPNNARSFHALLLPYTNSVHIRACHSIRKRYLVPDRSQRDILETMVVSTVNVSQIQRATRAKSPCTVDNKS